MTGQQQKQCSDVLKHCQKTNKQEKKKQEKTIKTKSPCGNSLFSFFVTQVEIQCPSQYFNQALWLTR